MQSSNLSTLGASLTISDISTGSDQSYDSDSYTDLESNSELDSDVEIDQDTACISNIQGLDSYYPSIVDEQTFHSVHSWNSTVQEDVNPICESEKIFESSKMEHPTEKSIIGSIAGSLDEEYLQREESCLTLEEEIEQLERLAKIRTVSEIINQLLMEKDIDAVVKLHQMYPEKYSAKIIYAEFRAIEAMFWNAGPDFHDLVLNPVLFPQLVDMYGIKDRLLDTSEFTKIQRVVSSLVEYDKLLVEDVDHIMKLWMGNVFNKRTFFEKIHSIQRDVLCWILSCYEYAR